VYRILGLGDSFTYGSGAEYDETYLRQLEMALAQPAGARTVEVINAGLPRYFPALEAQLLAQEGLDYHPDLVLVGMLPNDVVDTFFGAEAVKVDGGGHLRTSAGMVLGSLGMRAYRSSHLFRLVVAPGLRRARGGPAPKWEDIYRAGGQHETDWAAVEAAFARMEALTEPAGVPVVIACIPQQGPWGAPRAYPAERLSAWAASRPRVHVLDLLPALRRAAEADPAPLYFPRDGHCTPRGYRVIGQAIADFLRERGLVP
jgi:lysophospholipase L1-like esterase